MNTLSFILTLNIGYRFRKHKEKSSGDQLKQQLNFELGEQTEIKLLTAWLYPIPSHTQIKS